MTTPLTGDPGAPTVRQAKRMDLLAVHRIEQASFSEPWPYTAFETFLDTPGFLVADTGGVVGFVVANVLSDSARQVGHVKDLAVAPGSRGEGIGGQLLDRAIAVLSGQGVTAVKLEVRKSNDPARSLYRSRGFEHRRTAANYYADGEDALVLVRPI